MRTLLDFEKPIADLETKLVEMKRLALDNNVDVSIAVSQLEANIENLKKETFANLTRWQRVQLSRHPNAHIPSTISNKCVMNLLKFMEIEP